MANNRVKQIGPQAIEKVDELVFKTLPLLKKILHSPITDENIDSHKENFREAYNVAENVAPLERVIAQLTEEDTRKKEALKNLHDTFGDIQRKFEEGLDSSCTEADSYKLKIHSTQKLITELSEKISKNKTAAEQYQVSLLNRLISQPPSEEDIQSLEKELHENEKKLEVLKSGLAVIEENIKNNQKNHGQAQRDFDRELVSLQEEMKGIESKIKEYTEAKNYLNKIREVTDKIDSQTTQVLKVTSTPAADTFYATELKNKIKIFIDTISQSIKQDKIASTATPTPDLLNLLRDIWQTAEKINPVVKKRLEERIQELEETLLFHEKKIRLLKIQLELIPEEVKPRVQTEIKKSHLQMFRPEALLASNKAERQKLEGTDSLQEIVTNIIENKIAYREAIQSGKVEKYSQIYTAFTRYEKALQEYITEREEYLKNLDGKPENNCLLRLWYGFLALVWVNKQVISNKIDAAKAIRQQLLDSKNNISVVFENKAEGPTLLFQTLQMLQEDPIKKTKIEEVIHTTGTSLAQFKQEFFKPTSKYRKILKNAQQELKDIRDSHTPIQG